MDISSHFTAACATSSWSGRSSSRCRMRGRRGRGSGGDTTWCGRTARWAMRRRGSSVRPVTGRGSSKTCVPRDRDRCPIVVAYSHFAWTKKWGAGQALRQRKDAYETQGISITKAQQLRLVKVEKDTSPYAFDVHSHILQNVVADLDKAFQAFFRRVKAGEDPGYPRFKGKNRFAGFGFKEYGNGFKVDGRRPKPSGIG